MASPGHIMAAQAPGNGEDSVKNGASRRTNFRWFVLFVVALTYFLGGADRANLAVAIPYIKADFHLSNTAVGTAAAVFFIGVTIILIPAGFLFQKFGVRMIIAFAVLLTSLATFLSGMTNSAIQLLIARFLLGLAEGPLPIGGLTMLNRWFPARERATAVGIFYAAFKLAPALVPPIAAAIIYSFGWRMVFVAFAVPGIFVAGIWMLLSDYPRLSRRSNDAEVNYINENTASIPTAKQQGARSFPILDKLIRARTIEPLRSSRQVFLSANLWGCAIAYGMMTGLTYAIMTWVPTYLIEVKKYSILQMGIVASAPWIGAVIGSILGGILSDRVFGERRKPVMLIAAGATIFTMYALVLAPNNPIALAAMLVVTGVLLYIGYSTFVVYPMGLVSPEKVPLAIAIISTLGALGGGLSPLVVGIILDHSSWSVAFAFLSFCSIAAFILTLLIVEPRRLNH